MQKQPNGDHRRMVPTRTPGVYKRGGRYVAVYYVDGKQKKESARTYDEARALKARREVDVARGEFHDASRTPFAAYFREWVERYQGKGRQGFREGTRDEYRRLGKDYAIEFFGERLPISKITPKKASEYVTWLCEQTGKDGHTPLADQSVRNAFTPVRACLGTAVSEGLIRSNPTLGTPLPHRPVLNEAEPEEVRALTTEQLLVFLSLVHPRHRTFFRLIAATGLRISEAVALQRKHLQLDGSSPRVLVRRGFVRNRIQPPKSRHAKRHVPLHADLVSELRLHLAGSEWSEPDDLAFPSTVGTFLNQDNLRKRVLRPAAEEAGAPWMGFHTLRHTYATRLFGAGKNAVQVQRSLGHHSAAFTLERYIHLLDGDLGEPLALPTSSTLGGNEVAIHPTSPDTIGSLDNPQERAA